MSKSYVVYLVVPHLVITLNLDPDGDLKGEYDDTHPFLFINNCLELFYQKKMIGNKNDSKAHKWEVIYEDDDCTSIWKYNTKITSFGPVEVEYKYKRGFNHPGTKKTLGQLVKESKKKKTG